jgi:hypothetical protein
MSNKYEIFKYIQHNIKKIELFNTELPGNKGRIISSRNYYRNLDSYLKFSKYSVSDLYTLQEVQNSKKENYGSIKNNNDNYTFIYNPTGIKKYYYLKDDKKTINNEPVEREYGCMVVFNQKRFEKINIFKLNEFKELRKNASPLVHLQDKISKEHYLVLSLQGYDPTLKNIKKIKRLYATLNVLIEYYSNELKKNGINNFNFIIGCDLKYNIFKPKIINKKISSKKKSKTNKSSPLKIIKKSINKLVNTFLKYKIGYDLDNNINTVYYGEKDNSYQDCNDYIFKSIYLETYEIEYGCNFIGTSLPINNHLTEYRDDFEHKYIYCHIGLDKQYE